MSVAIVWKGNANCLLDRVTCTVITFKHLFIIIYKYVVDFVLCENHNCLGTMCVYWNRLLFKTIRSFVRSLLTSLGYTTKTVYNICHNIEDNHLLAIIVSKKCIRLYKKSCCVMYSKLWQGHV